MEILNTEMELSGTEMICNQIVFMSLEQLISEENAAHFTDAFV